jgi:hypothetical protein
MSSDPHSVSLMAQALQGIKGKEITAQNSIFIFLFGDRGSGKSTILSSLLFFMNSERSLGKIEPVDIDSYPASYSFYQRSIQKIASNTLPDRTNIDEPILSVVKFTPGVNPLNPLYIVLLDISGEDLNKIQTTSGERGEFTDQINILMRDTDNNIAYVLVTDTPERDDTLMHSFLNYLFTLNVGDQYRNDITNGVLLMIAKSDKERYANLEQYLRLQMPLTYGALTSRNGAIGTFKIGSGVELLNNKQVILNYDYDSPKRFLSWIYKRKTLQELYPVKWWKRLLGRF